MNGPRSSQRGLSLIEVLVALALMSLLSLMSWQALDAVDRTGTQLHARDADTLAMVRVLAQLQSDVGRHAGDDVLPTTPAWNPAAPTGALLPAGVAWNDAALTLIRSSHGGAWQQVSWYRDKGVLWRAAGPSALTLPIPGPKDDHGESMLDQVSAFMVRAWIPGLGWITPESVIGATPSATGMEITIGRMVNGREEIYRKVVPLP